jgi:hypothetical protein
VSENGHLESDKLFGAAVFVRPSQPAARPPLVRNVEVGAAPFAGLDHEVGLGPILWIRFSRNLRTTLFVLFLFPEISYILHPIFKNAESRHTYTAFYYYAKSGGL